jgi:hypothetical protein
VLKWVRSFTSVKETAQVTVSVSGIAKPLKNGSMKPSGSSQRGAAMHNLRGEHVELAVV